MLVKTDITVPDFQSQTNIKEHCPKWHVACDRRVCKGLKTFNASMIDHEDHDSERIKTAS